MHRFFAVQDTGASERAWLKEEDARHAVTVLRLKPGRHIEIFLDCVLWESEIISADQLHVSVRKIRSLPSTETVLNVTLYQGLPKFDKMDYIVQKATELGVSRIIPVLMNRCVIRPDPADLCRRAERWRKIAREAAKQSGRCIVPDISKPCVLNQLSQTHPLADCNIVPWEEAESYGPLAFCSAHPSVSSLGILIGPEGGITEEEIADLEACGFIPVTLGKRILRTETASLAAIAAFTCLYGEMEKI